MPIYKYKCQECKKELRLFKPASSADSLPDCQSGHSLVKMQRQISTPSVRAMETSDEYRNKKNVQDINKMSNERARDHWRKHELPRFIEENGLELAIKNGWSNPDGTPKL